MQIIFYTAGYKHPKLKILSTQYPAKLADSSDVKLRKMWKAEDC